MILRQDGSAAVAARAPKRAKPTLDKVEARAIRARTFRVIQFQGYSLAQIAKIYRFSIATISSDLKWLATLTVDGLESSCNEAM